MRKTFQEARWNQVWTAVQRFFGFFLMMCFVMTCNMVLFTKVLANSMALTIEKPQIQTAAILTFFNVILVSLLCTVIDTIRRSILIERPVKRVIDASKKVMAGDLSVRIKPVRGLDPTDGFNMIIGYFNRMVQELSGMETLRTDFIVNVSHELKAPLAIMQNYATMLQQPELSQQQRIGYAKEITSACRRLADLITNILKLSKLENQQIFPEGEAYDLGEQLCQCLLGFENAWQEKQLEICTEIAEEVRVKADPELLALVWNNLFSNAIKFTETGGTLSVSMRAEGDQAVVRVSDTGCGIAPEIGKHIFEKFYQGDLSHATQGNGLGLALVKRIVDIVKGDITVASEVGKGSTFTVTIGRTPDGAPEENH